MADFMHNLIKEHMNNMEGKDAMVSMAKDSKDHHQAMGSRMEVGVETTVEELDPLGVTHTVEARRTRGKP